MNTRGVMELVVLNIGLSAGIIDLRLYSVFVIMAVVTTVATVPVLRLIYPRELAAGRERRGSSQVAPVAPSGAKAIAQTTR
jgi:Kef-type K+ transport system membrane component KefB